MGTPDELWPEVKRLKAGCLEIMARCVGGELGQVDCRVLLRACLREQPRPVVALAARVLLLEEAAERAGRREGEA